MIELTLYFGAGAELTAEGLRSFLRSNLSIQSALKRKLHMYQLLASSDGYFSLSGP